MHRRRTIFIALLFAAFIGGMPVRAQDASAELMAAYLYNFTRFVEWPAAQFPSPLTPLVVCTPDAETLDGHLLRVHGRLAQNRRVVVREVKPGESLGECQVLFIPAKEITLMDEWLAAAAGKPVLTVSNAAGFTERGGMVGLFVEGDRVQFDIQRERTVAAGLRVSSRLMALARRVGGGVRP